MLAHSLHPESGREKRAAFCASQWLRKSARIPQRAVGDSTPGLPFRVTGPQGERLPMLEPEHLARRRRRVPAPTPGTVSPTALARRAHRSLQMTGRGASTSGLWSRGDTHQALAQGAWCQLTGFPCALLKGRAGAGGQALASLPKGTLVELGRHPPGPCSRGPVSAKWVPARLAGGSRGGSGRGSGTPLPKGSRRCIQSW